MSGEDRELGRIEILELLTSIANDPALVDGPPRSLMIVGGSYMALADLRGATPYIDSVSPIDTQLRKSRPVRAHTRHH